MKIGIVVPGFSADEADGCIPALLDLVRAAREAHAVRVFALRYPPRRSRYDVHGAQVHALGGGTASGPGRLPLLARALARIVAEGRRDPFDVLHAFWADEPGVLAVAAGRLLGVPAVVSVAGGELVGVADIGYGGQLGRASRWMTDRSVAGADRVAVGSRAMARAVEQRTGSSPLLLPLGVDTGRFSPDPRRDHRRRPGPVRLLHVGSLSPVKDQATLLHAFARVAERPDVALDVAGEGPLRGSLEALGARLGIGDRVTFLGAVPHDRLPELYRAADLFVLSSRHESQSLAALEAAACGTPAVGTAVGVIPELVPPDLAAPPGDAGALAGAILRLVEDDEARRRLRESQRAVVEDRFSLGGTIERLASLYGEIR